MRVSGKERDFYDGSLNFEKHDNDHHWHRKFSFVFSGDKNNTDIEKETVDHIFNLKKDLLKPSHDYLLSSKYFADQKNLYNATETLNVIFGYIFFCGKVIPYVKLTGGYKNNEVFYTSESIIKAFKAKNADDTLNEFYKNTRFRERARLENQFTYSDFKNKFEMFLNQNTSKIDSEKLHLIEKNPIYILDVSFNSKKDRHVLNNGKGNILVNGRLDDYQFAKFMNPYICVQELEMYIGNNLVGLEPIKEFNDKIKITSHGFDLKESFRKGKTKK